MNEQNFSSDTLDVSNDSGSFTECSPPPQEPEKKKTTFLSEIYDYFELFVVSACIVLFLFSFATRLCRVDGPSMLNSLHDGEMLIVSDLFYTPERGDIIVFHQTGEGIGALNEPVVKRVIATEGEWISIKKNSDNTLTVTLYDKNKENQKVLIEPYANYEHGVGTYQYSGEPIQIPEGSVFVMGDNRGNSQDSRATTIGFVDIRRVLGKVVCRVTPFEKFGKVD